MMVRIVVLSLLLLPVVATLAAPTASARCAEEGEHLPRGAYVVVDVGTRTPGATCDTGVHYYGMG